MTRSEIYALIDAERIRQDEKHPRFAYRHHHRRGAQVTPSLLATLRAAGRAATKGPWSVAHWDGGWQIDAPGVDDCIVEAGHGREGSICDAEFIAIARNHWDELLDAAEERDRLRERVKQLTDAVFAGRRHVDLDGGDR